MFQIKENVTLVVFWIKILFKIPKIANIEENHTGKKIQRPHEASLDDQTLIKFDPYQYKDLINFWGCLGTFSGR